MVLAVLASVLIAPAPALADATGKGGDFVPFASPVRTVDTRNGTGGVTGARGPGSTTVFTAAGLGGVPATGATAVLLDVTPVGPTAATYLTLWADGTPRPGTATINVAANNPTVSLTALVPLGANGKFQLYNSAGSVHVVIDVHGYFTSTAGSGRGGFVPVAQSVLFDTTTGIAVPKATIAARSSLTVQVTGGSVPATANAVYLNVVVSNATSASWLRAVPEGSTGGATSIDFASGTTSSGLVVKPGANGRVTIYNASSGSINLRAHTYGYFSASSTEGAGYRPATGRLINGAELAANGHLDVQVAGLLGMPAKGVSAVALNLSVSGPTGYGYYRAWPLGAAEPSTSSFNHFAPNQTKSDMALVEPGVEGRIRIKNVSTGTVRLFVDIQGWFAKPVPPVAVRPFTRVVAFQGPPAGAALGAIEYAYVDNIGRLVHGHQSSPDSFSTVRWETISGDEAFSGPPALNPLADSRTQVLGQSSTADLLSRTQTSAGSPTWDPWANLSGGLPFPPTVAKLPDGTPLAFAADADGVVWRRFVTGTNTEWRVMGDLNAAGELVAVTVRDGIQVFAVDTGGALRTGLYTSAGAFTGVANLGGSGFSGVPAVVVYPGYRIRLVVRGAGGTVVTKAQDTAGVFPAAWDAVGSLAVKGSPAALLSPVTGTAEFVVRGTDDELYSTGETGQGTGTWRSWTRLLVDPIGQPVSDPSATDPTVFPMTNANGASWAVVFRNAANAPRLYWVNPNPAFTAATAVPVV
ncbi:hypothetical protein [Saccharothrix luteola]|uniref:hypothetical protein n=1 Tax=Saccharothrix luteola TaxID=2893018 RepID=UPI001E5D51BC|nr:hypothetical protein [Saccharothrix luteola]MCC8242700.1 hypothetical protein [Saccharothrix luteola]